MNDPIKRIVQFNYDAGLIERGYDDFLESSFLIEEALEGFDDIEYLYNCQNASQPISDKEEKDCSREIVRNAGVFTGTDVDRLDKACDAIVFAVGSMAKLRLTTDQITQALNIVMDANEAKIGCEKDEHGKLQKPANFPNPEPLLEEILKQRG